MPPFLTNLWTAFTDWLGLSDPLYLSILAATLILGFLTTMYTLAWPTLRPPIRFALQRLRKRTPKGLWCKHCGFDLTGSHANTHTKTGDTNPCPECGKHNTARTGERPLIWKRRWITGITALLIFSTGIHLFRERAEFDDHGWWGAAPSTVLIMLVSPRDFVTARYNYDPKLFTGLVEDIDPVILTELRGRVMDGDTAGWQTAFIRWRIKHGVPPSLVSADPDASIHFIDISHLTQPDTEYATRHHHDGVRPPFIYHSLEEFFRISFGFLHQPSASGSMLDDHGVVVLGNYAAVAMNDEDAQRARRFIEWLKQAPDLNDSAASADLRTMLHRPDDRTWLWSFEGLESVFDTRRLHSAFLGSNATDADSAAISFPFTINKIELLYGKFFRVGDPGSTFEYSHTLLPPAGIRAWAMLTLTNKADADGFARLFEWVRATSANPSTTPTEFEFTVSGNAWNAHSLEAAEYLRPWRKYLSSSPRGQDVEPKRYRRPYHATQFMFSELEQANPNITLMSSTSPSAEYALLGNRLIIFSSNGDAQQIIDAMNQLRATWQAAADANNTTNQPQP